MKRDREPGLRVAVVGRPNVGKSTLVNRLAARRGSIVGPTPGLTRDRVDARVTWRGRRFTLEDTGGLVAGELRGGAAGSLSGRAAAKAVEAAARADLVLFVVDAASGATSDELGLAKRFRRLQTPLVLVANKVDDDRMEIAASELWGLGLGEPVPISALHGRGAGDLLDRIVDMLPPEPAAAPADDLPSLAIVGRPNVGKSSLLNAVVGWERAIVHPEPGTTRDSIDTIVEIEGTTLRFVDTAGLRRRAKRAGAELPSAGRAREAIERADLAIVVVDASEGATSQDQRIARGVAEAGCGALLALNKWDLIGGREQAAAVEGSLRERLHFVAYAPMIRTSALTGRGVIKLVTGIAPVLRARNLRAPTARFNELLADAQQRMPPPRSHGHNVRVLYGTQAEVAPPSFVLFATGRLAPSWIRYLERRLREEFGFEGNPVRIVARERTRGPGHRAAGRR